MATENVRVGKLARGGSVEKAAARAREGGRAPALRRGTGKGLRNKSPTSSLTWTPLTSRNWWPRCYGPWVISPRRTEKGPDRGVDVIATSDSLGLDSPRVKVQVKQRSQRVSVGDLPNFIATLRAPDKGLFVSTSGFTREALYEADGAPHEHW